MRQVTVILHKSTTEAQRRAFLETDAKVKGLRLIPGAVSGKAMQDEPNWIAWTADCEAE